ncbi:MAG: hypothetical protein IT178_07110 [Acidobacteria bacterium]|nr:hypothetical protein [Acidobacteriota bacterium]
MAATILPARRSDTGGRAPSSVTTARMASTALAGETRGRRRFGGHDHAADRSIAGVAIVVAEPNKSYDGRQTLDAVTAQHRQRGAEHMRTTLTRVNAIRLARLAMAAILTSLLAATDVWAQADEVVYYHTDAIGSVRTTTDAAGAVIARYDFLPFGEAWDPPTNPDQRQFAGKSRDAETGLDYFAARYYASLTGRFTTVDPVLNIDAALTDPQRWNRYTYALNRPLVMVDPDGREAGYIYLPNGQMVAPIKGMPPTMGKLWAGTMVAGAVVATGPTVWRAAVGCFLSPSCQSSATQILEEAAGGAPRISSTGDIDAAATALAQRLGGRASVAIEGFAGREFDVVSQQYVGQTFGGASALLKPDNFLSSSRREQIRATLTAAKATGRKALFEFRNGVHDDVLDFIRRNAERIGAEFDVHK